jgi:hypothetical protein
LPPVIDSVSGLSYPLELSALLAPAELEVVLELLLELSELLEPHAASSTASPAASASAATDLIDLIKSPPVCIDDPSSGVPWVQGVL